MARVESSGGTSWLPGRRVAAAGTLSLLLLSGCASGGGRSNENAAPTGIAQGSEGAGSAPFSPSLPGRLPLPTLSSESSTPHSSSSSSPTRSHSPSHPAAHTPSSAPTPEKISELVDNRNGARVFSDTGGAAPKPGVPGLIEYGVEVKVDCYAPNSTGMTSINALYHVVSGQWSGSFIPANVMDNVGGILGPNAVDLDPRVPPCPPGTPGVVG